MFRLLTNRYFLAVGLFFVLGFISPDLAHAQNAPTLNQPATCYGDPYFPKVDLSWSNTGASSYTIRSCRWSFCAILQDAPGCTNVSGTSCTAQAPSQTDMYYWVRDNSTGLESARLQVECLQCSLTSGSTRVNAGDTVTYFGRARLTAYNYTFAGGGTPSGQAGTNNQNSFSTIFTTGGAKQVTLIAPNYTKPLNCPVVNVTATPGPPPPPPPPGGPPPPPGGPPPPPPPPPSDTTRPIMSNIKVINITSTSATVTWDTNEPATSQVEDCLKASHCSVYTNLDSNLVSNHSVSLAGLTAGTYYYVWARSSDGSGNLSVYGYVLFKTLSANAPPPPPPGGPPPPPNPNPGDTSAPTISNVQVFNITRDTAAITWDSSEPGDSRVMNCPIIVFCFSDFIYDQNFTTQHSFTIVGLRAERKYYIKAASTDAAGNQGLSNVVSFKTLPGLVISNVQVLNVGNNSFTLSWDTNYPSDSRLVACTFIYFCYFAKPTLDPTVVSSHTMTLSGLSSGRTYYYQITSVDPAGYTARSAYTSIKLF